MIIPAIDMQNGKSVRLYQGDFAAETLINESPLQQAHQYQAAGIRVIHLVDLDGAKVGHPVNQAIVETITHQFSGQVEIGGGIRMAKDVQSYFELGIDRVILGSIALKDPDLTKNLLAQYGGEKIVIGVDGQNGQVATEGWLDQSQVAMGDLIGQMVAAGAKHFIVTDVSRDGAMQGPNVNLLADLQARFPRANIIASGGIRDLNDIKELQKQGIHDSVVGRSIYEGTISLAEIAEVNRHVS